MQQKEGGLYPPSNNLIAQQGKRWRAFCPCRRAQNGERRRSLRTVYRQSPCLR